MKRLLAFVFVALTAGLYAQTGAPRAQARTGLHCDSSEGHLHVATTNFEVSGGDLPQGELTFAAEHHTSSSGPSAYPELIVSMSSYETAKFDRNRVTLKGPGRFNDEVVRVEVTAVDGGRNGRGDTFTLSCRTAGGVEVFWASGEVVTGDISIQGGKR